MFNHVHLYSVVAISGDVSLKIVKHIKIIYHLTIRKPCRASMILYDWMLHGKAWWMRRGFLVSSGGVITDLKSKLRYKTQYCCWMLKQLSSMCNYIIMIYDVHFVPWCVAAIFASWLESKFKPLFCMNSGSCSHLVRLQPSAHDAVLTPRACATLIFGDENEMALCDARPAMVSLWINTSTYLYHFFWMNIQNCNLFLVGTEGVRRVPGFCPTAVRMFFCWWLVYSWLVGELLPYTWLFGGSWISMVVIFTVGWAQRHPQRMSPQGLLRADTCSSIAIESRKGTIFVMYTTKWPVGTTQILMCFLTSLPPRRHVVFHCFLSRWSPMGLWEWTSPNHPLNQWTIYMSHQYLDIPRPSSRFVWNLEARLMGKIMF